jgi:hypothetical protein
MKTTRSIPLPFALLLLASVPSAQPADWRAVEQISVKLRIRVQCDFSHATDTALVCEPRLRGRIPRGLMVFRRAAVQQMRIERVEASTVAGAAIGTGTGAALGASSGNGTLTRGGGAVLLGGIGGIVGGFVGKGCPFLHGEVVYQKP